MTDITLPEQERYEIGLLLGQVIDLVTRVIAMVEHVEQRDVFGEIVERYIAELIVKEDE
jgi:hypothetical protein